MKKIFFIVVIITLPAIAFFQYKKYKRFNPASSYEYPISDSIDVHYYDQAVVDEYYTKAIEIGSFARLQWANNSIDVRFPDLESREEMNAAKYHNLLVARVQYLEDVLKAAFLLKSKGYSSKEIRVIESGVAEEWVRLGIDKEAMEVLRVGDNNRFVWRLQKRLIEKGYPHELDGLFGIATQTALISYQTDQGIYPSGAMNEEVYKLLFID